MAMLVASAMMLGTAWVSDDAFITLRVIDNFINGYGLRFNVIERVQVFTHPLWLMLLTPFYALTRESMFTAMLVSVGLSLGAMWLLATKLAQSLEVGYWLVAAAMASGTICSFSTSGLETPLTFFLLVLLVWKLYHSARVEIPAAIVGLLLLNRLDMVVLLGPAAAYLLIRARGRERNLATLAIIFPALAWMAFSVFYYGAPFPNTAYAKLGNGFSTITLLLRGAEYIRDFVFTDPLLALIIGKAVFDSVRSRNITTILLGVGIVCYVTYTIIIGGDFMSGRFFAVPGLLAICLLARSPVPQWLRTRQKLAVLLSLALLGLLLVARILEAPMTTLEISENGISDERRFYYADTGLLPVLTKWVQTGARPVPQSGRRGLELKAMGQGTGSPIVVSAQAIGMRGYYGGTNVYIVDEVALADAFLARLPAVPESRVGHYRRLLPPGYAETVGYAVPATDMELLRPLLHDVTLATRAPLFTEGRWDAIWRLASGYYHWVYETDIYGLRK